MQSAQADSYAIRHIVDSGIDFTHPDLKNVPYTFTADQQDTYGCGPYGRNFAGDKPVVADVKDYMGHGTHVAGIVAAEWNGKGVSGVANDVQVFSARVFENDGNGQSSTDIIEALYWLTGIAKDVNLKAVNLSLGSPYPHLMHTVMANELGKQGANTVYASGNLSTDLDESIDIGAQNTSPFAITVNAATADSTKAQFSCYGQTSTDVLIAGAEMLSTIPADIARSLSGSSKAITH